MPSLITPSVLRVIRCGLIACSCLALCSAAAFAQNDPRVALHARAGWDALAANKPREAAESFRQALAGDPKTHCCISERALLRMSNDVTSMLERHSSRRSS